MTAHTIANSLFNITCQSERTDIHPPISMERGNHNREVKTAHYVRFPVDDQLGVKAFCAVCCPVCNPVKPASPNLQK